MQHLVAAPWLTALLLGVGACGARARPPASPPAPAPAVPEPRPTSAAPVTEIDLEPMRIEVARDAAGRPEVTIYDARELFDQAVAAQRGESHELALELYARLLAEFPDSALVPPALYNAGLALEGVGDLEGAVAKYQELARRAPGSRDALDGRIRAAAVLSELGRFGDALATYDALLSLRALTDSDRVELLARRGAVLVETRNYPEAEKALRAAISLFDGAAHVHLDTSSDRAMSQYYLGEIPRRQAAAVQLRLPDEQLRKDLEAKAHLVLLAQERYQETIALGNLYWATAAGFQMASMQEDVWRALVTAPVPPQLTSEEVRIYMDEVRAMARGHLEKALEVHTRTVEIAERLRVPTPWSEMARRRAAAVSDLLARESRGERVMPDGQAAGAGAITPVTDPARYVPARVNL